MAFNWPTFRTRAITAVIFAAVMLGGLFWNHWSFFLLFSVIHFGCWWEYFQLHEKIHHVRFHPYTKYGFMLAGYGVMLWFCGPAYELNGFGLKQNFSLPVSGAGFILLAAGIFKQQKITLRSFGAAALGLLYISLSWGLMTDLSTFDIPGTGAYVTTMLVPCVIIFSIWINDTMAYIVGSFIGKTPLSPISPKKTWEGTIGGIILCVAAIGLFFTLRQPVQLESAGAQYVFPTYTWYIIAAIAAVAGTFGDLLESFLKRRAGVKDSGSIMPGHGGFLDRFDSLLLATPFVWLFMRLL